LDIGKYNIQYRILKRKYFQHLIGRLKPRDSGIKISRRRCFHIRIRQLTS